MTSSPRHSDLAVLRRLLRHGRRYWPHLATTLVVSLLALPLALLTPVPLKIAVDGAAGPTRLPGALRAMLPLGWTGSRAGVLGVAAGLLLAVTAMRYLQALVSWLLQTYTGERLMLAFRAEIFRHAQRLSLAHHDRQGTGDTVYRILYDAPAIRYVTIDGLIPLATAVLTLIGMTTVIARLDWQIAVVTVGSLPLLVLLSRAGQRRLRAQWEDVKTSESHAMSVVQEALGAVRVVKAFGQEDREHRRFLVQSSRGVRGQMRVALTQGGFDLLGGMAIALGSAGALILGVRHVWAATLTVGELLVIMAYLAQLYAPVETMTKKAALLQSSLASADRVFSLLDQEPDVVERPNARPLLRAAGAIAAESVSFAYEADRPVLVDVSFAIPAGARVGVLGTTGSGKSTLLNLLTRFYDPTAGRVLLDGVDLRDYRVADLRGQFALVLQEPVLFQRSIAENIAYARPGATEAEIVAAAQAANAHDFITRLPQGYDTRVGERGMRLSGGERQRISIARAFLRDAPLLLLDEPTSSLDTTTERMIMEAMSRLMHGRTTFMIAHRLSTLRVCDVCLHIERGRLVRQVTPDELLWKAGERLAV